MVIFSMLSFHYTKTSDPAWCNDKNTDHSRDSVDR